jgi:excinuclease ABC subunit C
MGLAKRHEHIFLPGVSEPVVLLPTSPVLHLVQHIRDEAHRFAVTFHRRLRGKAAVASVLRTIPGIGAQRATRLLNHFGSVTKLGGASVEEIARAARISPSLAEGVLQFLRRPSKSPITKVI